VNLKYRILETGKPLKLSRLGKYKKNKKNLKKPKNPKKTTGLGKKKTGFFFQP
jgi:hypothetical protein